MCKCVQTSDQGFRAISALISAASPEKIDRKPSYEHPRGQKYPPDRDTHLASAK